MNYSMLSVYFQSLFKLRKAANGYLGIQCRRFGNSKPAIRESGGPKNSQYLAS
jgi:hypothetical protein